MVAGTLHVILMLPFVELCDPLKQYGAHPHPPDPKEFTEPPTAIHSNLDYYLSFPRNLSPGHPWFGS